MAVFACLFDCLGFFNVPKLKQWGTEVKDILNEAYSELLPRCLVQENSLYHDLCLLFVLHWRAAKEIGGNSASFK